MRRNNFMNVINWPVYFRLFICFAMDRKWDRDYSQCTLSGDTEETGAFTADGDGSNHEYTYS